MLGLTPHSSAAALHPLTSQLSLCPWGQAWPQTGALRE